MNTNRFQTIRKRPTLNFRGISPLFWSGTVLIAVVLLGILYCMLTRQLPI